MNVPIDYLAVFLAAVASMVVGFVYYHPSVVGKYWMAQKGLTPESLKAGQKEMTKFYALSFVVALITAYILAHTMFLSKNFYNYSDIETGCYTAFWMWLGFIMPVQLVDQIFGDKKWKLFGINTLYQLIALVVMGLVIGYFGIG